MNRGLPGKSSQLLLDIPPLRLPRPLNVLRKFIKTTHFLKEAFPLFAIGSLIISTLKITGGLDALSAMLKPLTVSWLGLLPAESSTAFIMGIVRRDFGAAGLNELTLTSTQIVTSLLVITLFVPCIASILVLFKERNKMEAAIMWLSTFVVSFAVGGIIHFCFDWYERFGLLPVIAVIVCSGTFFYLIWRFMFIPRFDLWSQGRA